MSYFNKDYLISKLTKDDVIKICSKFGSGYKTDSRNTLIFNTQICHEGGKSWKLYYYHEPNPEWTGDRGKRFHCFTCGSNYDIVQLIIRAKGLNREPVTYHQALLYLASQLGLMQPKVEDVSPEAFSVINNDLKWLKRLVDIKNKKPFSIRKPHSINECILEVFSYIPITWWLNEGISQNSLDRYQIGYYSRDNAITIPHRYWEDGALIGIKERLLNPDAIESFGKYIPISIQGNMCSYQTSLNLYGLYENRLAIENIERLCLVEAEKSVLLADTYFGERSFVVATCGSQLSRTQVEIIRRLKIRELYLCFDKEYDDPNSFEAESYKNKLIKICKPLLHYMQCYLVVDTKGLLQRKDSPFDRGKDVLLELMHNKIEVTYEDTIQEMA